MVDSTGGMLTVGLMAMLAAFALFAVVMIIVLYIYFAFVLMTIAKKLKYNKPWLAWIPIANFALFPILAKKHWAWVFILLVPIVNIVFLIIWTWSIFEQRNYPRWLSLIELLSIVPFIGWLASIIYLVIWGLVAWMDR